MSTRPVVGDASAGQSARLLLIELNEFNPQFLARMAEQLKLLNTAKIFSMCKAETSTADLVEHQGLDPWVQWVGVHCGKPTTEHGIRRLGATRTQTLRQIWHLLAQHGYTWGVWGAMNAPLGNPLGCKFFMPDPWSFDEAAFPHRLDDLLALPRYVATNYLEIDRKKVMAKGLRLLCFFAPPSHWPLVADFAAEMARALAATGPSVHAFSTLLDYLSVLYFLRLRRKTRPDFSLIFLNHIAHLQHQFWVDGDEQHPEMALGLRLNDAMLGLLLAARSAGEALVVMNGLKQENVAKRGSHVYRQIDPRATLKAIGIEHGRVEQCMTNDAHILFRNMRDADNAQTRLERCRLSDGHRAFFVERESPVEVFYQLAFEHEVAGSTRLLCGDRALRFYDVFQLICERTGAHVPEGDVFYDGLAIPQQLANHEVFDHLLAHFPAASRAEAA
jgi:hypothetical protein